MTFPPSERFFAVFLALIIPKVIYFIGLGVVQQTSFMRSVLVDLCLCFAYAARADQPVGLGELLVLIYQN